MHPIDLLIAGAAKAGTTSLKEYLGQHPGVCTHACRGINVFDRDEEWASGYDIWFPRYFQCSVLESKVIVAKSVRVLYSNKAMLRLRQHNPGVHLIVSLRNPIDRAYSDYWYARRKGWDQAKSFEEAIKAGPDRFPVGTENRERCAYLARSRYVDQLNSLLQHFEAEKVHVHLLEDMQADSRSVFRKVFELFDVLDPDFVPVASRQHNAAAIPRSAALARTLHGADTLARLRKAYRSALPAKYRDRLRGLIDQMNERQFTPPPMRPETRQYLLEYFREPNDRLSRLIGRDLNHWSCSRQDTADADAN